MGPGDTWIHGAKLVQIHLRVARPLGGLADHHQQHRTSGWSLGARIC
jgi:hypothetical protein